MMESELGDVAGGGVDPATPARTTDADSDRLFGAAIRHSPIGMAVLDPDGSWLEVNDALCGIVGYTREELLALNFRDISHPDDIGVDRDDIRRLRAGEIESYQVDKRYLHKNGSVVWIQLNVTVARHDDGAPRYIISQIQDITARKQVERVMDIVSSRLLFLDGPGFYTTAAVELARVLGADISFIGRIERENAHQLKLVALVEDGRIATDVDYPLAGTPCAEVVGGIIHIIDDDAQVLYPDDGYFTEHRIRAYAATPLIGPDGRVFGHLGVLKREPFASRTAIAQTLNTFGLAVSSQMIREANRRQYEDLFERAPDALLMTDRSGEVMTTNRQARALFGRSGTDLNRCNVRDLLPLSGDTGNDPWRGLLESTRPRQPSLGIAGFQARRENGATVPVEVSLNPMETEAGSRVVISVRNISERVENQRALRLRDQAIDAAGVGMMIIAPVKEGLCLLDVNQAFSAITGFSRDEVVGRRIDSVLDGLESGDEAQSIHDAFHRSEPAIARLKGHRRDGEPFWSEISISPVTGDNGRDTKFVAIISDVTDRIDTEERLRLMADALPVMLAYFDGEGRYRMVNHTAEQWYARPAAEILGKLSTDIMSPEHVQRYRDRTNTGSGAEAIKFESGYTYPDGNTRITEVHHIPHVNADGNLAGHYTMVIDITERENVRARLNQSQRMESIGKLSGGVAHDFNNLLSVIQGNLQLLSRRSEVRSDATMGRWVNSALDAVGRGADLTHRLLAFSRRQPLQNTVIDVAAQLMDMNVLLQRAVGELIEVTTRIEDGLPCIEGDLSQFENAVLNLAVNARDAMPRGGRLGIEAYRTVLRNGDPDVHVDLPAGDYVVVEVRDNGIGMEPAVRSRAFEPFFTTKEAGRGTGLGLASVFGYVKQCGGHASISSEPGRGTIVRLHFPSTSLSSTVAAPKPIERGIRRSGNSATILAVDDNPEVLEAGAELLRSFGYHVLAAENGDRALAILESGEAIDLVYTDMVMPGGLNGLELAERVRAQWPDMPILFTSGYAEEAMRRSGSSFSRSEWIHKPVDIDELETKIVNLLDSSPVPDRDCES